MEQVLSRITAEGCQLNISKQRQWGRVSRTLYFSQRLTAALSSVASPR